MKIIRRTAMLIVVMLPAIACGSDDDGIDESAPPEEWCESLWEEGLAPSDWDHARFMRDCLTALEAGFARDVTLDIYEERKAAGG